jgi:hypothetical protein
MDIRYLSVLTTVHSYKLSDYVIAKNQNDDFENFINNEINFKNADVNHDNFLTYSELSNVKLSATYNAQKDRFELRKGFNLLSTNTIEKVFDESGLSLKLLEENLKELDKNRDNKITSSEIAPDLTKIASAQKREYRELKLKKLNQEIDEKKKISNDKKKIESLDKQIENLRKMLRTLKIKQATIGNASYKSDTKDITSTAMDKKTTIEMLKSKYGDNDIDKLVNTISTVTNPEKNISRVIYQSGTQANEKEIAQLVNVIQNTTLNQIDVKQVEDMNAIEQFSPANTPISFDKNNIDLTISSIEQKIQALESLRDKIIREENKKLQKELYFT